MSKKEITSKKVCKNCGTTTQSGYYKYTCDGCHGSMTKKEVEESVIDFNASIDDEASETGSTILDLHFHGWNCLFDYIENLTEDELKKHEYWCIWAHNNEVVKALREVLLKADGRDNG